MHLKDTSRRNRIEVPFIEVPDDLKSNLLVTSVDALVNWGRKSALWPVSFGLGLLRLRDDGNGHGKV